MAAKTKPNWPMDRSGWSPYWALKKAATKRWLIQNVIPESAIVWAFGEPGTFKSFIAMSMVQAISTGTPWMSHATYGSVAVYLAAEGGTDVDVSRAAADWDAGCTGPLAVIPARPMMCDATGLATLVGLFTRLWRSDAPEIDYESYLDDEEREDCGRESSRSKREQAARVAKAMQAAKAAGRAYDEDFDGYEDPDSYEKYEEFVQQMALDKGLNAKDAAQYAASRKLWHLPDEFVPVKGPFTYVVVIDTFAMTSNDDTKEAVNKYTQSLAKFRDMAAERGMRVTFIVLDHTTKDGESYLGSQAKLGNCDVMIEVTRQGESATLTNIKMRGAAKFAPIHLDLVPFTLDECPDALGQPLTSLVVKDGSKAHELRQVVGANADTAAALVLELFRESGPCAVDDLRGRFLSHTDNVGKNADSVKRAFRRALTSLVEKGLVVEAAGNVTLPGEAVGGAPEVTHQLSDDDIA